MEAKLNKIPNKGVGLTKFKPEILKKIFADLEESLPLKLCCQKNGVHESTFYQWLQQAELDMKHDLVTDFTRFAESLRDVEIRRQKKLLKRIEKGKHGHKGSEWILERCHWRYYSSKAAEIDFEERLSTLEGKKYEKEVDSGNENEKRRVTQRTKSSDGQENSGKETG